ncbi:MAG: peptidase vanX D-ala-D-ala dipeptidase [Gemmatimonadetes bacterium]|nr:peptidase vanX D-ala-D-ala dipeptidase [Gemmatimonadota bacterium]
MTLRNLRRPLILAALGLAACARPDVAPRPAVDCPPVAPGTLVDVRSVDPTIRTDVRYATANNFTGAPLPGYESARALLLPDAARGLARVQARLRGEGLGLKLFDAYRPVRATLAMVDWAERTGRTWVLDQGYVARKSGHNLGVTVDLTLVRLRDGRELDMGTPFDTFSDAAHTANATGAVAENRRRLVHAMAAEGFASYDAEWWHFRLPGDFPALDIPIGCIR